MINANCEEMSRQSITWDEGVTGEQKATEDTQAFGRGGSRHRQAVDFGLRPGSGPPLCRGEERRAHWRQTLAGLWLMLQYHCHSNTIEQAK